MLGGFCFLDKLLLRNVGDSEIGLKASLTYGKQCSLRGLRRLHNEVLIISASWEVSLMVVVFSFSGQMGGTIYCMCHSSGVFRQVFFLASFKLL